MTDKHEALRWNPMENGNFETALQMAAVIAHRDAELEILRAKLKTYEDLGDAADDVQLLRMGYAAARLEIESLRKERADELAVAYMCGASREKELAAQQPDTAYAELPEPLEIEWPELHSSALGCGVEDRGLHNRYECAEYGWQDGVDKCAERVPEQIFDADQMRAFADATCALRPPHGQAPAQAAPESFLEIPDVQDESGINSHYSRELVLECINAALAARGQAPAQAATQSELVATMLDALKHAQKVLNHNNLQLECAPINAAILAAKAAPAAVAGPSDGLVTREREAVKMLAAAPIIQPAPQQEAQEPATIDQKTMELAESVGLIGPASRVGELHAAIQRFHDLICVNATIKAAVMAADVIRGVATPARDYPPLPMQFACSGVFPVYSADQMRAYVDADRAMRAQAAPAAVAGPSEQQVFEEWLSRVHPSGDAEAVQAQWERSGDYLEWLAAAPTTQPAPQLPERDASVPAEQQGLFRKFEVRRVDGTDKPGGKHHGCTYFVLDVDHDPCARPALAAYAAACEATHPALAADLLTKWGAAPTTQPAPQQAPVLYDPKALLSIFQTAQSGSSSTAGILRGIAAVIASWESRADPHTWLIAAPQPAPNEDEGISREQWIEQAMRVYLIAGDTEQQAEECAKYLWGELDLDDLADPYDAAMSDVEGRGPAPQPLPAAQGDALDAERWRMAALVGNEVMVHPDKRNHAAAVAAYMQAVSSGLDLTAAIDAARAAQEDKQ